MAGITYIAKFADDTYKTRYGERDLKPKYRFAWRAGYTADRHVASHWCPVGVRQEVTFGFSGARNLAHNAATSHLAYPRQQGAGSSVTFRDFHEEVVEVRYVMARLSNREMDNLEAVYDAAIEFA